MKVHFPKKLYYLILTDFTKLPAISKWKMQKGLKFNFQKMKTNPEKAFLNRMPRIVFFCVKAKYKRLVTVICSAFHGLMDAITQKESRGAVAVVVVFRLSVTNFCYFQINFRTFLTFLFLTYNHEQKMQIFWVLSILKVIFGWYRLQLSKTIFRYH